MCFLRWRLLSISFMLNEHSDGCKNTSAQGDWGSAQNACTALGTKQHSNFLREAQCAAGT